MALLQPKLRMQIADLPFQCLILVFLFFLSLVPIKYYFLYIAK